VGLFGKAFGLVKGIAKKALGSTPAGSVVSGIGGKLLKRLNRKGVKAAIAGGGAAIAGGVTAAKKFARTPGGMATIAGGAGLAGGMGASQMFSGGGGRRYRRINPGNTRAMRRAIRRIEAGAKVYSKFFGMKSGRIKGAHGVKVKKLSIRRAA